VKRRCWWLGVLALGALWVSGVQAGLIGPSLEGYLATAGPGQKLPVTIALRQQADNVALEKACAGMAKEARWAYVVSNLKRLSEVSQRDLLAYLASEERAGGVSKVTGFWIVNAVYCEATPEVIRAAVARPEVWFADYDLIYSPNILNMNRAGEPATGRKASGPPHISALEWNVHLVGADSVWNLLGYTGNNVIVGHIDTGCNYNHVDLAGHMWNSSSYPNHGWNFELNTNDPMDVSGHGTHTAGTVASNGTAGDTCGMAPHARIMVCRVRTVADSIAENQVWAAQQFCVSPPLDPTNHAQEITMSLGWYYSWSPRLAMWRQSVTNVATAGLPFQIAAGNEDSSYGIQSLRVPGSVPGPWKHPAEMAGGLGGAISIAATDINDAIASFSSRGPVHWDTVSPYNDYAYPPGLLKPDVAAPGVNITSTAYNSNTGYLSGWSGTSMATPCVSGIVALMLSKNPLLTPRQVDSLLQYSVRPLGPQPKNTSFGTGRVSAYLAVLHTPLPGPTHDVAIASILTPGAKVDPLVPLAPKVIVHNNGTYDESGVPVRFRVDSSGTQVYNQLMTITTLDSAGTDTVTFPNWTPGPAGRTYNLTAYHSFSPDTNRSNDTLKAVTQTRVHEVSTVSTSIGPKVRGLYAVTPQLTLGNPGDYTEHSFNATCWIDSSGSRIYNQTVPVDSVISGGSKTVSFPVWNTGPVGATYNVTLFNSFADQNHGNDTLHVATQTSNQAKALIAFGDLQATSWALRDSLVAHDSSGLFSAIDTFCVASGLGGRVLPLSYLTSNGYNVVFTFTNYAYADPAAMGDTMAAFMEQGGGVVVGVFADYPGWAIGGRYATQYMPFPTSTAQFSSGTLGTVHLPNHPIMQGITAISIGAYRSGSTTMQHGDNIASWNDGYNLVGAFDTLGRRTAEVGLFPTGFGLVSWGGDNTRLMLNAMCWAAGLCNPVGVEVQPALGNQPRVFALAPARPNPVGGETEILYQLPTASPVAIRVYNVAGQVVRTLVDAKQEAGYKRVTWDGRNDQGVRVGAGVYLYRMEAGSFMATRKMVVIR
jgi:subtilisin family serine protease